MKTSRFIAKVLGLFGVLFVLIVLVSGGTALERLIEIMSDSSFLIQAGFMNLIIGLTIVVGRPEARGSPVSHRSFSLPAFFSEIACSIKKSSLPASESASICSSQISQSRSRNESRSRAYSASGRSEIASWSSFRFVSMLTRIRRDSDSASVIFFGQRSRCGNGYQ